MMQETDVELLDDKPSPGPSAAQSNDDAALTAATHVTDCKQELANNPAEPDPGTAASNSQTDVILRLKKLAESTDPDAGDAMYRLGLAYHYGNGTPVDHAQAAFWYLMSAQQATEKSPSGLAAIERLEQLAALPHPNRSVLKCLAMCYADSYLNSSGRQQLVYAAAKPRNVAAMYHLGEFCQQGLDIKPNLNLATYFYLQCLQAPEIIADLKQRVVGKLQGMVNEGLIPVELKPQANTQLMLHRKNALEPLAAAGDAVAMYDLGVLYQTPQDGISPNLGLAAHWYLECAKADAKNFTDLTLPVEAKISVTENSSAEQQAIGTEKTPVGIAAVEKLAWLGNESHYAAPIAKYNLGLVYQYGYSVDVDC